MPRYSVITAIRIPIRFLFRDLIVKCFRILSFPNDDDDDEELFRQIRRTDGASSLKTKRTKTAVIRIRRRANITYGRRYGTFFDDDYFERGVFYIYARTFIVSYLFIRALRGRRKPVPEEVHRISSARCLFLALERRNRFVVSGA